MVIMLLLASLNSCTNPWIYMAFTDNVCKKISYWIQKRGGSTRERGTTYESVSDGQIKSTFMSKVETTNCNKGLFFANENAIQLSLIKHKDNNHKEDNGTAPCNNVEMDSDGEIPKGTPV